MDADSMSAMSHETHGQCFCCDSHCNGDSTCQGECTTLDLEHPEEG